MEAPGQSPCSPSWEMDTIPGVQVILAKEIGPVVHVQPLIAPAMINQAVVQSTRLKPPSDGTAYRTGPDSLPGP